MKRSVAPTPADANPQFSGAFMARAEVFQDFDQKLPVTATHESVAYDDLNSKEGSNVVIQSRHTKKFVRPGFTPLGLVPSAYASRAARANQRDGQVPPIEPVKPSARR